MAQIAYEPAVQSLAGAPTFIKSTLGEQPITESLNALNIQSKAAQGGNLEIIEKPWLLGPTS
jgi:hypothetical protein